MVKNISPNVRWSGVPEGTKELALIVDDPDAPQPHPFVHWVVCKIPPEADGLPEHVPKQTDVTSPEGAVQGKNSFGKIGYGGPAPPPGHGAGRRLSCTSMSTDARSAARHLK
jgi:Raf kinase inhibitor-like YbhB/YbcL family protein